MRHNILYPILLLCFSFLLASCANDERMGDEAPSGKVKVELSLPGIYGTDATTRTDLPRDLDPIPALTVLPDGSTLWVIISKKEDDGDTYTSQDPKPYKVIASEAGHISLYPMKIKEEGNLIMPDMDVEPYDPLYLEPGTYKFRMISPAKELDKDTRKATVNNGEYLYATDERYNQTKAIDVEVTAAAPGSPSEENVQRIYLNPMIQQTARMKFTLVRGASVHSMDIYNKGIEVTGIQNIPEGVAYNWGSENVADTLEMKRGDKRGIVYVEEIEKDDVTDEISGHVGVLPTNAESNSIVVLFNLVVNGVPTQYMATLNKMVLLHAHSYNFKFSIGIENGVAVATPLYESWTIEQTF